MRTTTLVFLVSIFFCSIIIGQASHGDNKDVPRNVKFVLEYTPNFSKITSEWPYYNYKLAHYFGARVEFNQHAYINPSIGISYLNTGLSSDISILPPEGVEKIETRENHNYLIIPVGLVVKKGAFYLHPEIGLAINVSNSTRVISYNSDGSSDSVTSSHDFYLDDNKLSVPLMMEVGRNIQISDKIQSYVGMNIYYSLTSIDEGIDKRYYGLGIATGLRI